MKINQIISEGKLRGNWNIITVNELTGRQLAALKQNATRVGDQEVLGIIAQIEQERADYKRATRQAAQQASRPAATPKVDPNRVMYVIDNAIGNAFPDADPIDQITREMRKLGVSAHDLMGVLDRSVRATKSGESYHDYVRDVWQQHLNDNPDEFGTENPW